MCDDAKPVRSCVACRTRRPQRDLLRVARTPGGAAQVDIGQRSAGRGAYLCRAMACLEMAERRHALRRTLKIDVPAAVFEHLRSLLNAAG